MSYRAMPFVFLNMGGEMVYILQQRLQAQKVGDEKAQRVLADIMSTMFNRPCLQLLFEPQPLYSRPVLRHYFEQIAHSSVMRLNETSMDKLFDLMSMAVKYQVLLCKEPSELVLVTMNHLDGMRQIFTTKSEIMNAIDYAQSLLMDNFVETPLWEMAAIRSELMNYFAGQRIKISLMLREGRQMEDGRFVLFSPNAPIELPYNCCVPGTVRYVGNLGEVVRVENFSVEEKYSNADDCNETAPFFRDRAMSRGTTLGKNMYSGKPGAVSPTALGHDGGGSGGGGGYPKPVGNELQLLEMLLKGPTKANKQDGKQEPTFSLSLFEDDATGMGGGTDETSKLDSGAGGKGVKPRSAQTRLSKKLKESMKLEGGDEARPTSKDAKQSNSRDSSATAGRKKKATRGEQMLEMMDSEVKGGRPASRPKSRGKSPAGVSGVGTNSATGNKVPMRNSVVSRAGGRPTTGSTTVGGK